jgi:lipopolysaccharide/colanic/teichoic acid biosynthesis glycosyltransferase
LATSDPVINVIPSTAPEELRTIRSTWNWAGLNPSLQAASDFFTVLLAIWFTRLLFAEALRPQEQSLTAVPIAAMIVTVLAFNGAYTRDQSPLGIANTEGLVRGVCCSIVLGAIACGATFTLPCVACLCGGALTVYLLIVQREFLHVMTRRVTIPTWEPVHAAAVHQEVMTDALAVRRGTRAAVLANGWAISSGTRNPASQQMQSEIADGYATPSRSLTGSLTKRVIDLLLATPLLILSLPLFLFAAVLIKIESRGPVFFRQQRIGKDGVPFFMWKFRSMCEDSPRYERSPISDTDLRLTTVGRILRRLSLDELPQLINVVKGEMSLVGPRPEMPFIVAQYGSYERRRLQSIPGITGLWQISPARAMPIHENVDLDLFYIERQTIFLDIAILVRTFTAVIRGIGAT